MPQALLEAVLRTNLSDDIALHIRKLIQRTPYEPGARLPAIADMATQFRVGAPTLREALKKLEALGVVDIRHGSGVYVGRTVDSLVISNPFIDSIASKQLLIDLVSARIPVELETAKLAAKHATSEQLGEMGRLLARARKALDDASQLNEINLAFHRQIALGSGNPVLHQILEVLSTLFRREQRMILDVHGDRESDHHEHVAIHEALAARDAALAVRRMRSHLERVRDTLHRWDPIENPVS